ncbi:MAG: M3 family oligoendopeptidase [Anaerolineaceae bacterium]|nr:M3 family oligoendopeptidase [Anaerolineaceae bacterium]
MKRLSKDPAVMIKHTWQDYEPYYKELETTELNQDKVEVWLKAWSDLTEVVMEQYFRLNVLQTLDTSDEIIENLFNKFVDETYPKTQTAEQNLRERLLASGIQVDGFDIPLRNMRAEVELFHQDNLPLLSELEKLTSQYDKLIGAQTVQWEGEEVTLSQLSPIAYDENRNKREKAWRLAMDRRLVDREALNKLWVKMLDLRIRIAENLGLPDYRAYVWKAFRRFDYSPQDCKAYHDAIEQVVVPAAKRILTRRRERLGLESVRPWDDLVDTSGKPALKPFKDEQELIQKGSVIFHQVDEQLGLYFDTMIRENLVDLSNRKNKAPGAYSEAFPSQRRPFVFMNAVGVNDDVRTLFHEFGHAFHVFESANLPYYQQMEVPMEFAEVASMAMEYLTEPYLTHDQGGYYDQAEAARSSIEHLEQGILFWPYMAVVDAFQHWVYENPQDAMNPAECDAAWEKQWDRFMKGYDWSGLDEIKKTGWHRKLHIFHVPFYYVEYGLAMMGAVQVWANARQDQQAATAAYRKALALGGTVTLPQLFETAGAKLAFDAGTLQRVVGLMEDVIEELETVL